MKDMELITKIYAVCFQISLCKLAEIQKIAIAGLLQLTELIFNQ